MKSWRACSFRFLNSAVHALLIALVMSGSAWAQQPPEKPQPSWVMSYVLVFVCVSLSLFAVCRGAKRFK